MLEHLRRHLFDAFAQSRSVTIIQNEIVKDENPGGTYRLNLQIAGIQGAAVMAEITKEGFLAGYLKGHLEGLSDAGKEHEKEGKEETQ